MKKIPISKLESLLSRKSIYVSTPPLMEMLLRKFVNERVILLPTEFSSKEELEKYSEEIKGRQGIIIGRGYVVDLIRGKIRLGESSTKLRGYILIYTYKNALKLLSRHEVTNKGKVLEYSSLPFDNCVSFSPQLISEGIELDKKGKLDEQLKIVNKFKLLLYKKPRSNSPLEALKEIYRGENLKSDWEKLTDLWKEVIYYYLDSSLGLLPGQSRRELQDVPVYSSTPSNLSEIPYPEYIDLVDYGLRNVLNGKNVYIVGSLRSGKTTLASLIAKRAEELGFKLNVVDYHGPNGYNSIEKIVEGVRKPGSVVVLTYDIYKALRISGGVKIKTANRLIQSFIEKKNFPIRLEDAPLSFLLTSEGVSYDDYYFDYMFNVIFGGDANRVIWYLPLLKIAKDYGVPIPKKLGRLAMEVYGRKVNWLDELVINWFSVAKRVSIKVGVDYGTDQIDEVDLGKLKEEFKRIVLSNLSPQIAMSLIELYYYTLVDLEIVKPPDLGELRDLLLSGKKVNGFVRSELEELMPSLLAKTENEAEKVCTSLKSRISLLKEAINSDKLLEEVLSPHKFLSEVKIILNSSLSTKECVETSMEIAVSIAKGGKTEWIKTILPELIKRAKEDKEYARLFSVISFYYLLEQKDESLEREVYALNDEYSVFPISVIKFKKGELASLEVQDPLKASVIYGVLADYALYKKDLMKLAQMYEKFRKVIVKVKEENLKREDALALSDFLLPIPTSNSSVIFNTLDLLRKRLDAGIGYTLLLTHPKGESIRTTIEIVEKLSNDWFARVIRNIKEGNFVDEDCMDLLKMYQFKLMKSLAYGEKYEYKSILSDIIELSGICKQVKNSDIRGAIEMTSNLANAILYNKPEELVLSGSMVDLAIYTGSLVLLGYADKTPFFNVLVNQIKEKGQQDTLETQLVNLLDALVKGDKNEIEKNLQKLRNDFYSAMVEVLSKVIYDKRRVVLGLIPFIGMWHITGSRPRLSFFTQYY